jgi:hypothetical protein
VRPFEDDSRDSQVPLGHAQLIQSQQDRGAIQQTQHDRLAIEHGDHRDADVDFPAGDDNLNAAVLRQALFRDVNMNLQRETMAAWKVFL